MDLIDDGFQASGRGWRIVPPRSEVDWPMLEATPHGGLAFWLFLTRDWIEA
jgi:hypothetical protein